MLFKAALFFMGLNSIACSVATSTQPAQAGIPSELEAAGTDVSTPFQPASTVELNTVITTSGPPQQNPLPASPYSKSKSDRLSPEIFPPAVIDCLTSKMFRQPDPIRYLLEKIIRITHEEVRTIRSKLMNILKYQRDAFPSGYVPYARVLWNLFNCLYFLKDVKNAINNMSPSTISIYITQPGRLFSHDLNEFFSSDIFRDDRIPMSLIMKFTQTDSLTEKIPGFRDEIRNVLSDNKLPGEYQKYAKELDAFFMNVYVIQALEVSISNFRNVASRKSSTTAA